MIKLINNKLIAKLRFIIQAQLNYKKYKVLY